MGWTDPEGPLSSPWTEFRGGCSPCGLTPERCRPALTRERPEPRSPRPASPCCPPCFLVYSLTDVASSRFQQNSTLGKQGPGAPASSWTGQQGSGPWHQRGCLSSYERDCAPAPRPLTSLCLPLKPLLQPRRWRRSVDVSPPSPQVAGFLKQPFLSDANSAFQYWLLISEQPGKGFGNISM